MLQQEYSTRQPLEWDLGQSIIQRVELAQARAQQPFKFKPLSLR
jgi:hypothetical protein